MVVKARIPKKRRIPKKGWTYEPAESVVAHTSVTIEKCLKVYKNNQIANSEPSDERKEKYLELVQFMMSHPLKCAFFKGVPCIYPELLSEWWYTCHSNEEKTSITGTIDSGKTRITISEDLIKKVLELPKESNFEPVPTEAETKEVLSRLKFKPCKKGRIFMIGFQPRWKFIVSGINRSLNGIYGSQDQMNKFGLQILTSFVNGSNIDYGKLYFKELLRLVDNPSRTTNVPFIRLLSLLILNDLGESKYLKFKENHEAFMVPKLKSTVFNPEKEADEVGISYAMRFWINNPYDANAVYKPYRDGFEDNVDDMDEANPKIQDLGELVDVYELKNEVQEDEVNDHETIVEVKKRKISECETSNIEEVIKRVVLSNEVEDCAQSKVELIESSQLSDEDAYKFTNDDISQSQPKKKLLILDIYGILVDIVDGKDATIGRDYSIGSKSAVYKRPYCDDFLDFCFKNFFVCVWSSTTRWEMEKVLNVISKDLIERFAFCLDQTDCINTGEKTPENMSKPLFLKDVRKLWLLYDAANPFDEDFYNVTNTILLDNSPYKALCNPPYTAIFPVTYDYRTREDNCLGPDGNIRKYLERLAACDNVQNYIKKNPFGQEPISEKNKFWNFYLQIKRKIASRRNKLLLDYINNNKTQSHMLRSWNVENASSIIE